MDDKTRAPIWYAQDGVIDHSRIDGIKCLRECADIQILHTEVHSPEFGWKCAGVEIEDSEIESEYLLFESRDIDISRLHMKGQVFVPIYAKRQDQKLRARHERRVLARGECHRDGFRCQGRVSRLVLKRSHFD